MLGAFIEGAGAHGLDPAHYRLPPDVAAMDDEAVRMRALRLARDLRDGRVAPREADPHWYLTERREPLEARLAEALAAGRLEAFLEDLPPPHAEYRALQAALLRLTRHEALTRVASGAEIIPWSDDPRWPDVLSRLQQEGHLQPALRADRAAVAEAIRAFQRGQGLAEDGRIGRLTLVALGEGLAERRARIVANMERWRWMPRLLPRRHVLVNIAVQQLHVIVDGAESLAMPVVVGRVGTPTPSFSAQIAGFIVNPPWTIPAGIARDEILPRLKRDPRYLETHEIRLLNGPVDDPHGLGIDWRALPRGRFGYVLQQAPGPANPLGAVRFEMPNPHDIFLHDTPAREGFTRQVRALSHGCIRLSDAVALTEHLAGLPAGAFADLLEEARSGDVSERVPLPEPVGVFIVYLTAIPGVGDELRFAPDIYGRDASLVAALARYGE